MESWNTETYNTEQQYSRPLYRIMAVQLTEFCPPLVERTNERGSAGTRTVPSRTSKMQNSFPHPLFQGARIYFFFFLSFFFTGSRKLPPSRESMKERKRERERGRESPRVSKIWNSTESIWKIGYFSRWTRVHRGDSKAYSSEIGIPLIRREKKKQIRSFSKEMFVFFFHPE